MEGRAIRALFGLTALSVLIAPATAGAKASCEWRGTQVDAGDVSGLPEEPRVGEAYAVTVSGGRVSVTDGRPTIGLLECSADGPEPNDFRGSRLARSGTPGEYTADVRFPGAGRWAVSVVGLRPAHLDLGMHTVRARPNAGPEEGAAPPSPSAGQAEGAVPPPPSKPPPWPAIGALGLLGLTAGACAVLRSRSRAS